MNGRRWEIQIIGDILRLGKAKKTTIMYSANMSYSQLVRYLNFLLDRGFLRKEEKGSTVFYRLTPKGQDLLFRIDSLISLLELTERETPSIRSKPSQ